MVFSYEIKGKILHSRLEARYGNEWQEYSIHVKFILFLRENPQYGHPFALHRTGKVDYQIPMPCITTLGSIKRFNYIMSAEPACR